MAKPTAEHGQVRLQRYLASAGVAARRKAESLITEGRVSVNGEVVTVLGTKIDPDTDRVTVDGEAVVALDTFYVLLNKPKGCITAVSDDRGRPTVMDYLLNLPVPVKPVGRLDFYSEGVLLLTNDGELAARLLAPASHVPKTYHVKVHGQLSAEQVKSLRAGIVLDDGSTTMPAEISVLPGESRHTWLGITIHEGKHRQIHRMIEALGYRVDKLQRVAFANLTFHDLRVGDARELTQQELNALRDLVGLDHSAVARGRWRSKREATDIPRRARAKALAEAEEIAEAGGAPAPRDEHAEPPRRERPQREPAGGAAGPRARGPRSEGNRGDGRPARGKPSFGARSRDERPSRGRDERPSRGGPGFGARGRDERPSRGRDERPSRGGPGFGARGRDERPSRGRDERPSRGRDERPSRGGPGFGARGRDERPSRGRDERPSRGRDERPSRGRDERPSRGGPGFGARSRDERPSRGRSERPIGGGPPSDRGPRQAVRSGPGARPSATGDRRGGRAPERGSRHKPGGASFGATKPGRRR
ncbi:MAG: pseudouridine synthase [Kofleriaceae bacterium]